MYRVSMTLVCAAAVLLFVAQPVLASTNVDAELAEMRELVDGLKQKVDAQQEQLSHQGELLEDAQKVVQQTQQDTKALSGLASFVDSLEVEGGISASYFWNFNTPQSSSNGSPGTGGNQGIGTVVFPLISTAPLLHPFHPDHNAINLDQAYFGLGKPATAESRAGFKFDMIWGVAAGAMTGTPSGDLSSTPYIHQAYIEYLAPIGDGLDLVVGKFAAPVGNESMIQNQNFNITYSILHDALQPINMLGATGTAMAGPVEIMVGIVNGAQTSAARGNSTVDETNRAKTFLGGVNYKEGNMAVRSTLIYGAENVSRQTAAGGNSKKQGLADLVITLDPSDELSLWLNADYLWVQGSATHAWGVAAAGRMAVSDRMGVSLRAEYLADHSNGLGFGTGGDNNIDIGAIPKCASPGFFECDGEIYSITGTVDYALADNLILKGEVRFDQARQKGLEQFPVRKGLNDSPPNLRRNQVLLGAQLSYVF